MEPKPMRKVFRLDPSKDYPNGLGLSREEIEEGYNIIGGTEREWWEEIERERREASWLAAHPEPPAEGATGAQIRAYINWLMARNEAVLRGEIRAYDGCGLGEIEDPDS
jgi:hypothetical protein